MNNSLLRLIDISSSPLGADQPTVRRKWMNFLGAGGEEFLELLSVKNGFFAYESALHFYPADLGSALMELNDWNEPSKWRYKYNSLIPEEVVFFGQNVFGEQFGLLRGKVIHFDPETGKMSPKADSLGEWSELILAKPNYELGHSLAHNWQVRNGGLKPGFRLVPKTPFIAGGQYEIGNFASMSSQESLHFRSEIYQQTKDLPEGAEIRFKVGD